MKKMTKDHKGFTLLEIIVVLAVIGALAAILAPVVFRYIDDARRARAQGDVQKIAEGLNQMYKDTGRWAFFKDGTAKNKYTTGTDAVLLTSNVTCGGQVGSTCDPLLPTDGSNGTKWQLGAIADNLSDQLIFDTPFASSSGVAYATGTTSKWNGPYLIKNPGLDPWGRSYLVNIANADPAKESFGTQQWVIAISAGSDGILQTDPTQLLTTDPVTSGDDVLYRVK